MIDCEHCGNPFSSKLSLKIHQSTAQYCLQIQGREEEIKQAHEELKCDCGSSFSKKCNFTKHLKICKLKNPITSILPIHEAQVINNNIDSKIDSNTNNTNNITNTNVIDPDIEKTFNMTDLNKQYILECLTPVITAEIAKQGMEAITEVVVDVLLQQDGKYCYYCTDKSRKKFVMIVDYKGEILHQKDPSAKSLRNILVVPLKEIIGNLIEKHQTKALRETYKTVKSLKTNSDSFTASLAARLPSDPDGIPECMKDMVNDAAKDSKESKRFDQMVAEQERKEMMKNIFPNGIPKK